MENVRFLDVVTADLAGGAIINDACPGFREDYLALHCLLRRHQPARVMEVGTFIGTGTKIICNAVPAAHVMSLDLPYDKADVSKQHPSHWAFGKVGSACDRPYEQLWGDSVGFSFSDHYPIDAWFIDGEHDYSHPFLESLAAIESGAKLIVFHDVDEAVVADAIAVAFLGAPYRLFRVEGTRVAYALRNE